MVTPGKVVLYVAMSLDGYIAKCDGDIGFLAAAEQEGQDYGYSAFIESVDAVIMGRKTYDKVVSMGYESPHPGKEVYIISRTQRADSGLLKYHTGSLKELVGRLKDSEGKNVYCDGGAEIVNELLKDDLIDEFVISVIPVLLGGGVSLFKNDRPEQRLRLIGSAQYEKGVVQMHFERIKVV